VAVRRALAELGWIPRLSFFQTGPSLDDYGMAPVHGQIAPSDPKKIVVRDLELEKARTEMANSPVVIPMDVLLPLGRSFEEAVSQTKRILIVAALERSRGSVKKGAAIPGMTRNSIDHHVRPLGIRK
jgi:transcriptional regulator with GAF, ATPase, and Fis domain